ncbi:uncharacterized protein LOC118821443 [Colossoma macropomum]|uniref:uncharacterized protein LOC118821443 n=1 Tax=Colossoma macropomum TaxID=42526 RepID=UPI0018654051|nr:uncharacterized protein LOC118821443 [Colossoma macropomum]
MAVDGTVEVFRDKAPDAVKQALWKDTLNLRDEVIHLQHVNQCLTHSENTVRQLQLENSRLRNMESALLERTQVAEWALRLATESRRQKDKEILQLREQNQALVHTVQQLRRHCWEKHCCHLDYSQSRAKDLTKDKTVAHQPTSHCSEKNEANPWPNRDEKGFALNCEQTKRVMDRTGDEDPDLHAQFKDRKAYVRFTTSRVDQ